MSDLDTAIRAMLRERAQDVTTVPARVTDVRGADLRDTTRPAARRTPRTVWLVAAAVAAVLAVGGAVIALRAGDGGRRHVPAGTAAPSTMTAPSTAVMPVVARTACRAGLPPAWRDAFGTKRTYGADAAAPVAMAGADLVVTRDFGSSRDIALVGSDGRARSVYAVPDPNRNQVLTAAVDGHYLVVPVSQLPRNTNGVLPTVVRIDVVDLRTGAVTAVTTQPVVISPSGEQGRTIDGATIFRGQVYYDVRASYTTRRSDVHAYDLTRRTDRTVGTSKTNAPADGPVVEADGLHYSQEDGIAVANAIPAAVHADLTTARARTSLVTDGRSWAYSPLADEIAFWTPGMSAPTRYVTGGHSDFPFAVTGAVVIFTDVRGDATTSALDTRSAAKTSVPSLSPFLFAQDGVLAAAPELGTGVLRIVPDRLPQLSC